MTENLIYGIGFLTGLLITILVILLIRYISVRKFGKSKDQFDERQILTRGTAYKVSFFVAMVYMLLCLILDLFEVKWAMFSVQMIIGIFVSCCVFVVICIFTNSYFGVTGGNSLKKAVIYIVLLVVIGIMNIVISIFNMYDGEIFFTDMGFNTNSINIITAIFLLIIASALIIKIIAEKIEEKRMVE